MWRQATALQFLAAVAVKRYALCRSGELQTLEGGQACH